MADVSDPRSRSIARRGVPASLHRRSRRARPAEAKPIGIENPDSLAPSASAPSTGSTEPRRPSSWSGATQVSTWSCRPRRRVRDAGAMGQLTVRADSGFYAHAVVAAARRQRVRFSITIRQSKGVRRLIEAIPEDAWTPIPYWIEGGADVAETTYIPFKGEKDAVPHPAHRPPSEADSRFPARALRPVRLPWRSTRSPSARPGITSRPRRTSPASEPAARAGPKPCAASSTGCPDRSSDRSRRAS